MALPNPPAAASVKSMLVDGLTCLPTLRTQQIAGAVLRRAWPGFREA
jgi:hypothetical protein